MIRDNHNHTPADNAGEPEWTKETPEEEPRRGDSAVSPAEWERVRESYAPETGTAPAAEYRPQERRGAGSALIIVLIVVLVAGMAFAGYKLGSIFMNYQRDRSAYKELADKAISEVAEDAPAQTSEDEEEQPAVDDEEDNVTDIKVSKVPISVDWDYLRSENSDIVGWLYCPGTIINYPVLQNPDNEYYLKHGFHKESNVSGALFVDASSVIGSVQSNCVIYGHNMKDKSMFGSFQAYINESYCDENPTLYLLTPDGNYRIDLFGAHVKEGTVDNFPTFFYNEEGYQSYLDKVTPSFYWLKEEIIDTSYQLVTLTTCTAASGYSDARLLIQGVMVPIE